MIKYLVFIIVFMFSQLIGEDSEVITHTELNESGNIYKIHYFRVFDKLFPPRVVKFEEKQYHPNGILRYYKEWYDNGIRKREFTIYKNKIIDRIEWSREGIRTTEWNKGLKDG